ncbi:hypothetical protein ACRQ5D_10920 [Mucilaginibacter sp. P25]|uniref:hypothetical protein n=1 Tax=Mucilaginibacter sp. P25 TaxID=3423945 RepID=UPI003D7AC43C
MPGITIATPLPTIAWSKNPIVLQIFSDDYFSTAPAFSVNTVSFPEAIAPGAQIGLSWNAGSAGLTAAEIPDDSGNQFPSGDGSAAYVTSLVAYFQSSYFIDQAFKVSADVSGPIPKLVFTAKVASTDYDITPGTNQAVATPGTSGSSKANFMHHVEVWKYVAGGTDIKVYDNNLALDEPRTGTTTVDIRETLHAFMAIDTPSLVGYWHSCPNSCWQYYVKYAQFYGDDPSVKKLHKTGLYTVVYGGYSNLALQQISDRANYLLNYLLPDPSLYAFQRWLETWPIDAFDLKTNQPQFLSFINNRSIEETFKIRVVISFDDGTTNTVYLPGGVLHSFGKVAVGTGYQQLGLQAYTTSLKKVSGYQLRIVEANSLENRSVVKSFTINREYEEYTRHFIYSDSAGNFKTLHTSGRSETTSDVEYDLTAFQPDISYLPEEGNYRNSNIKAVLNDKVNTGYIVSRAEFDPFVEVQLAKQLYRVFGSKLMPIVGTSKSFTFSQDGKNLSAWVFEYRLAYDEDLYTADSYALSIPSINQPQQALNDL